MYSLSDLIGEYVKQSFSVYFGKSDNNNKSKTFQAFYRNLVSTIVSKLFSLFWWTLLWNMSSNSVSTDAFWHAEYLQCFMFWFPLCAVFCSSSKVMVWTSCIKLQFCHCTHICSKTKCQVKVNRVMRMVGVLGRLLEEGWLVSENIYGRVRGRTG